jgi:hypothetical protein
MLQTCAPCDWKSELPQWTTATVSLNGRSPEKSNKIKYFPKTIPSEGVALLAPSSQRQISRFPERSGLA